MMEVDRKVNSHIKFDDEMEATTSTKLGDCEVCKVAVAKYTCPRCEVRTCCLQCAKIHKRELECDGERDRVKYLPMKQFTNLEFSSDYRLLEEITRSVENSKKANWNLTRNFDIPSYLVQLRRAAITRKTVLKFLPYGFQRHKANTTRVNFKQDVIFWHIQWVFVNADSFKLCDEQIRESYKLGAVFSRYLTAQDNPVVNESLKYYQAAGLPGIRFMLRAEGKSGKKFYELDPSLTLRENFAHKQIIEFPIIHLVLKDHANGMEIIDSDCEEDDSKAKVGGLLVDDMIKRSESNESIYLALKNLLFVDDTENMSD